jgi:hypothetical protein
MSRLTSPVPPCPRYAARTLGVLLLAAAGALPSAAQPLQLAVEPATPTWVDPVRIVAAGDRLTSCHSFRLSPAVVTREAGGTYLVDVALLAECPPSSGATTQHIDVGVDLGRLDRGSYRVRFADPNDLLRHELSFAVPDPGIEQFELPALSTNREPGTLRVTTMAPAARPPSLLAVSVHDHVVEARVVPAFIPFPYPSPYFPLASDTLEEPLPPLAAGDYEVRVLGTSSNGGEGLIRTSLRVWDADGCLPADDALCLFEGRFRVTGTWQAFDGSRGVVHARPQRPGNDRSGLLWFFASTNAEISIKAIDGCTVNDHFWVFVASGSNVAYDLTVTDTLTDRVAHYGNSLGALPPLDADIEAFPCD